MPRLKKVREVKEVKDISPIKDINPITAISVAGISRGNFVENKNPAMATMALEMLAEGKTYDNITDATGIAFSAIIGLKTRHADTIDKRRKQLAYDGFEMAEGLRQLAFKKMKMLSEDDNQLMKVPLKDLVLPYAIAQDKGFQALGENTIKVEHTTKKLSIEDARKLIEEAKKDALSDAIDVTPVTTVTNETKEIND